MKPKFTIKITNEETSRYVKAGVERLDDLKKKVISGKTQLYEILEVAKKELEDGQ